MKSVLLIGIGGVYNYGCEAIVRGTTAMLRAEWPDINVVYASCRPDDDRARLEGCNVEIIRRKMARRYSPSNIARKLFSLVGVRLSPRRDSLQLLNGIRAVLSIGGDIFTLNRNGGYNSSLAKFGDAAEQRGIPYILWGASVGPFSRNPEAEQFFKRHLTNISLISAREKDTVAYLAGLGISSNVVPCADPAYAVAPEIVKQDEPARKKTKIAINLSPLSVRALGLDLPNEISKQARTIEQIVQAFDADVVLVPHVVCRFAEGDDDLRYQRCILNEIGPSFRSRVQLLDTDPGFVGTKKVLLQCDLTIAARMHCAINAMAAHVPTLLLAYSPKAHGMCEYIYGHREWVLPLAEFGAGSCKPVIAKMLQGQTAIQSYLAGRIPEVQADARHPIARLRTIMRA